MAASATDKILIVGCGCFGVSTAYHLLKRGFTNVTVLDQSQELPAPDAASNDLNRIVRSSYSDKFYCGLAREAISLWKDQEWEDAYHESGVIVLGSSDDGPDAYAQEAYANDLALGANLELLATSDAIRGALPPSIHTVAAFESKFGYLNRDGGWADAGKGLKLMIARIVELGARVLAGKEVGALIQGGNGQTAGVQCIDGATYDADLVVIATGSWTPSAFPGLGLNGLCLATGQCIAMIQLTEGEAIQYQGSPVILDFKSGFYVFPPNQDNVIKMAIHSVGYTHTVDGVSIPRTIRSNPLNGTAIPKADLGALRDELRQVYPDLAEKPFSATRMCWYNDSPDGDWVISRCPEDQRVILATAGSGHAYKFLPNIGSIVVDLIENKLEPAAVFKFSVKRPHGAVDPSRNGQIQELDISNLCTKSDLLSSLRSMDNNREANYFLQACRK